MIFSLFLFVYLSNYVTDVSPVSHSNHHVATNAKEHASHHDTTYANDEKIFLRQDVQTYRSDFLWSHAYSCYYKLHNLATNWQKARQMCEAQRATLLIIKSLDEMENLKVFMSNMKAYDTAIFVGIHDRFADGIFVTVDGDPIAGTVLELLWAEGSPNNFNNSEHCVVMTREGLLDDRPCSDVYPFICKIFLNQTYHNSACDIYDPGYAFHNKINGKCYKFHEEPLTWHDAYLTCKLEQGQLAIINSLQEATIVATILSDHLNDRQPNPDLLYLGFSDLMFPYQYRTIKGETLQQAGFQLWTGGKEESTANKTKRCGAISRNGYLTVTYCDVPSMFLCEKVLNTNKTK